MRTVRNCRLALHPRANLRAQHFVGVWKHRSFPESINITTLDAPTFTDHSLTCIRHRSRKLAVFRRYLLSGAGFCLGFGWRGAFLRRSTSIRFCIDLVRKLYLANEFFEFFFSLLNDVWLLLMAIGEMSMVQSYHSPEIKDMDLVGWLACLIRVDYAKWTNKWSKY